MGTEKRHARLHAYVEGGRNLEADWQTGFNAYQGFLPLEPFLQLQDAVGWEWLHNLNREYINLSPEETPYSDSEKIQQSIQRSSATLNVNLVEFYQDWGFSVSAATQTATEHYPVWHGNPMQAYRTR